MVHLFSIPRNKEIELLNQPLGRLTIIASSFVFTLLLFITEKENSSSPYILLFSFAFIFVLLTLPSFGIILFIKDSIDIIKKIN